DTVIDGKKGQVLLLNDHAQIFVDNNATLTLRNVVVRNTKNNPLNPCLKVGGNSGKLALDNVVLAMANDITFAQGQLYIHNDVLFSGTSSFIYRSPAASFVAPSGILKFDIRTTFSFAPTSTTDHLFQLQDRTSTIYLNGCTLKTTNSGMRLTKGNLVLNNKVILDSNAGGGTLLSTLSTLTSADYCDSSNNLWPVSWSPDGKTLAIGGSATASGIGGFANTDRVRLYTFNGSTLTALTSVQYTPGGVESLAWSPDGKYLAVSGNIATSSTVNVIIYSFNGSTLTLEASATYGNNSNNILIVSWSPDGKYLAVGGDGAQAVDGFANTDVFRVYQFTGSSLTAVASQPYGTTLSGGFGAQIFQASWSPDGKVIAIGGYAPTAVGGFSATEMVRLYSFNGSSLTALTALEYGTPGGIIRALSWNPSGTVLAIGGADPVSGYGGFANTDELRLYKFNGTTLSPLISQDYGSQIYSLAWNLDGTILAVGGTGATSSGGFANTHELRLYSFDGSSLTPLTSKAYGLAGAGLIFSAKWNPNSQVLALGGSSPANGSGGFTNSDELRLYGVNYTATTSPQSFSRSIVFGNSAVGASANLNVEILGAAHVTINGIVNDDSV
ncbi:WD40 repeat domain-containing protein, partial [Candidatus Dependentiae bacterium]|nr:WD40 repeat domain-containing protein [Candidatus Dependentiae bacterium]